MANSSVSPKTPEWALSAYLREIGKFPMLSRQEEYILAARWKEHQDAEAARRLVTSHLRLVARIAVGYRGYALPLSELVAEGNFGMMQAVARFDPDRGFRFAAYAMWWIRAAIQQYVLHSWSLVKIGTTASKKRLFFKLRKLKRQLRAIDEGDLSPEHVKKIAAALDVSEPEVVDMNRRLSTRDLSLNEPVWADSDGEVQDWLVDQGDSQESRLGEQQELDLRRDLLRQAMTQFNERERDILVERRLKEEPATLRELSQKYGISRERIRQIEARAYNKLQKLIRSAAVERQPR